MGKNYKMVVQYDSTCYGGWQRQGNTENTIQSKLESMTRKMTGEDVEVIGSGWTDAGVHATGQMASVYMDTEKMPREIEGYVNQYLPDDTAVTRLEKAPDRFHSRLDAMGKAYTHWIEMAPKCSVFQRKYICTLGRKLDVEAMRQAAKLLCGINDLKSLCPNKNMKKSTVWTMKTIGIREWGSGLEIHVIGDGFPYNMVRILVGTLIEVDLGKRTPDSMGKVLEVKDRQAAEVMVPTCGLFLTVMMYDS